MTDAYFHSSDLAEFLDLLTAHHARGYHLIAVHVRVADGATFARAHLTRSFLGYIAWRVHATR